MYGWYESVSRQYLTSLAWSSFWKIVPFDVPPLKLRRSGGNSHILSRQMPRVRAFSGTVMRLPSAPLYERVASRHGGLSPLSPRIFPMLVVRVTSIGSCDSKNAAAPRCFDES